MILKKERSNSFKQFDFLLKYCQKQLRILKSVLVIEYWNLRFICNLLARRLSGGVLGI